MANTSATGGYLIPVKDSFDLEAFLQTVFVGITGIPGNMVRPKWQPNPPLAPPQSVNWMAFSVTVFPADANAAVETDEDGNTTMQRQEYFAVSCVFYGPDAFQNAEQLRDGFQISQNREPMLLKNIGFIGTNDPQKVPDLVNEVWRNRTDITIQMVRYLTKSYAVLSIESAEGEIRTDLIDGENTIDWKVEPDDA